MENIETYELDTWLEDVLSQILFPDTFNNILGLIEVCNNINALPPYLPDINLLNLESDLSDLIEENENAGSDYLKDRIEMCIIDYFVENLNNLGIIINTDSINIKLLKDLYTGLYTLFTLDVEHCEELHNALEVSSEDIDGTIEYLASYLSEFVPSPRYDIYMAIDDIEDNFLDNLDKYLDKIILLNNKEIDDEVKVVISKALDKDITFSYTKFMSYVIDSGYSIKPFENNRKRLYNNLELYSKDNLHLIKYEIVLTLLLSEDTKSNILDSYKEDIDLSLVNMFGEEPSIKEMLDSEVQELVTKLFSIRS